MFVEADGTHRAVNSIKTNEPFKRLFTHRNRQASLPYELTGVSPPQTDGRPLSNG